ncbi:MAG: hypothetical protein HPY69_09295 [Armatimonadetes bacterium]|nr:hypothetical protein [Armatimonadota bacterium]
MGAVGTVRDIGSRLELFVDSYLVDRLIGCRQVLGRPHYEGRALNFDAPWEGLFAGNITVFIADGIYRMYYRGMPTSQADGSDVECTCYAHSVDGIHWVKPDLSLYERCGTRHNNVVLAGETPCSHNFCPFLDTRPGVPEEERFKAVGGVHPGGLVAFASADGVRWRRLRPEPVITHEAFAFDSQNVPFWSESEQCYVCYYRIWRPDPENPAMSFRWVARTTSEDFIHWTPGQEMGCDQPIREHIYTQQTHPYYRAPHIYLSLAARFWPDKRVLTDEHVARLGVAEGYYSDVSDGVLMTSRGGDLYERKFMESFLRPGPGLENWVSRTNYPALGVVPTSPTEVSLYAHRNYAQHTSHAARFSLRIDGFAAVQAGYGGGEMVTQPLRFSGSRLVLNYATSAAGEVRVELQDAAGQPLPGFALEECAPIVGDEIEREVAWRGGPDVAALAGQVVRLRFALKDAELYSLRFR